MNDICLKISNLFIINVRKFTNKYYSCLNNSGKIGD